MIVFSQGNYTFINNKEKDKHFSLLFKISSIEIRKVDIPDLGANFVISRSGIGTESSGAPYPGGTLYLQNGYTAVVYDSTKTSFKLVYDRSYKYFDNSLNILPTHSYSTPICRILGVQPKNFMFVDEGCIYEIPDATFDGLQADYFCLQNDNIIAAFGVHQCAYPGIPFPSDDIQSLALGEYIQKYGTAAMLQTAKAVRGLYPDNMTRNAVKGYRTQLRSYFNLALDLKAVPEFGLPVSDAYKKNGIVVSCLNKIVGQDYLNEMEELGEDLNVLLSSLVFDEAALVELIKNGIPESATNLLTYSRLSEVPGSVMYFLTSDFQSILDLYNLEYNYYKGKISLGALQNIKGQLVKMQCDLATVVRQEFFSAMSRKLGVPISDDGFTINLVIDNIRSINQTLADNPHATKEQIAAAANAFMGACITHLKDLAVDSRVDIEELEKLASISLEGMSEEEIEAHAKKLSDAEFLPDYTKMSRDELVNQILFLRLFLPFINQLQSMVTAIQAVQGKHHCSVRYSHDRGRWNNLAKKKDDWGFTAVDGIHMKLTGVHVTATQMISTWSGSSSRLDMDICCNRFQGLQHVINTIRSHYSSGIKLNGQIVDVSVNVPSGICMASKSAWNNWRDLTQAKSWGRAVQLGVSFRMINTYPDFSTALMAANFSASDLPTLVEYIPGITIDSAEITRRIQFAATLSQKFERLVSIFAANAAFEKCKPALESIKSNYAYDAMGVIGMNYSGVAVKLKELSQVCKVDEAYVVGLMKLIEKINEVNPDLYNALSAFRTQLGELKSSLVIDPIYYFGMAKLATATKYTSIDAALHYIYGGI